MKFKVIRFDSRFSIDHRHLAAVQMARESNVSVIQSLQKDLDAQLELVKSYTEQDNQLNAAINALQFVDKTKFSRSNRFSQFQKLLEQKKMRCKVNTMRQFTKSMLVSRTNRLFK